MHLTCTLVYPFSLDYTALFGSVTYFTVKPTKTGNPVVTCPGLCEVPFRFFSYFSSSFVFVFLFFLFSFCRFLRCRWSVILFYSIFQGYNLVDYSIAPDYQNVNDSSIAFSHEITNLIPPYALFTILIQFLKAKSYFPIKVAILERKKKIIELTVIIKPPKMLRWGKYNVCWSNRPAASPRPVMQSEPSREEKKHRLIQSSYWL